MDPITTAIIAVLPTLASDTIKAGVKDAYDGLKAVIRRKWGDTAPISKAISAIEEDPGSKAQGGVLAEKISEVKATEDADVLQALQHLIEQMKTHGVGIEPLARIQLTISGGTVQGVVAAENVTVATMNFGAPEGSGRPGGRPR